MNSPRSVPCPHQWCGAQPGQPCHTKTGSKADSTHSARAQVANPGPWNDHAKRYTERG